MILAVPSKQGFRNISAVIPKSSFESIFQSLSSQILMPLQLQGLLRLLSFSKFLQSHIIIIIIIILLLLLFLLLL